MLAQVASASLRGIEAHEVRVEASIGNGLPHLTVVGLPGAAVQESRERVRSAIQSSDLPFPMRRVVINLAPADSRKEGPSFDLPIALALLLAQQAVPPDCLAGTLCFGELALDGSLRAVRGAASIGLLAASTGKRSVIAPPGSASEVAAVSDLEVIAPSTLGEAVALLRGLRSPRPVRSPGPVRSPPGPDMADVKGQASAKRALEIAAAGAHNLLMSGPPGAGKTMLAARLPGILPDLTREEAIETTRIHSVAGLPVPGLLVRPPFRQPHHTISHAALVGGGSAPRPGEVSLAQNGVLFLDEMPELRRTALEALRQPLESHEVTISRTRGNLTFPARFVLVASRNPCQCGYLGDEVRECTCGPGQISRYRSRLSGPLLDRIDLRITVPRLPAGDLLARATGESSLAVRDRVERARSRAVTRQGMVNGRLRGKELRELCQLDAGVNALARQAITRLGISARGFDRLLRVARTIADLAGCASIGEEHLAEAVGYRD